MRIFRGPAIIGIGVALLTLATLPPAGSVALVAAMFNGGVAYAIAAVVLLVVSPEARRRR